MNTKPSASQEIVLPDGRFARLRPILLGDMLASMTLPGMESTMSVAVRCLSIDDQSINRDDLLALEYSSWTCISSLITKQIEGAFRTKDGIA